MAKRISIIIPTYNSEKFLESSIQSVLRQSYSPVELLIADGNSTDKTHDIVRKYENAIAVFESGDDKNMYDGINKCLAMATGDIWAVLNSDDFYASSKVISQTVDLFDRNPEVCAVTHNLIKIDECDNVLKLRKLHTIDSAALVAFGHCTLMPQPTTFFRKEVIDEVGLFDTRYDYAADYDYFIRVLNNGTMKSSGIYSTAFRVHRDSATMKQASAMDSERLAIVAAVHIGKLKRKVLMLYHWGRYLARNFFENRRTQKKQIQQMVNETLLSFRQMK